MALAFRESQPPRASAATAFSLALPAAHALARHLPLSPCAPRADARAAAACALRAVRAVACRLASEEEPEEVHMEAEEASWPEADAPMLDAMDRRVM